MLEAEWPVFCPNEVRAKNINAAEAKPKQSIGVCVASVAAHTQTCQKGKSGLKALDKKFCRVRP